MVLELVESASAELVSVELVPAVLASASVDPTSVESELESTESASAEPVSTEAELESEDSALLDSVFAELTSAEPVSVVASFFTSAAAGASDHVSSYKMVPSLSSTCSPMSSEIELELATE